MKVYVTCFVFRLRGQVHEVVDVMKDNIDKLLDRDVALNNLAVRADDLQSSATTYNHTAKQLRRKYWWKNTKVKQNQITFFSFVSISNIDCFSLV